VADPIETKMDNYNRLKKTSSRHYTTEERPLPPHTAKPTSCTRNGEGIDQRTAGAK